MIMFFLSSSLWAGEKLRPDLKELLQRIGEDEKIEVIVHMAEKPDLSLLKGASYKVKADYLRDFARRTQAKVLDYLKTYGEEDVSNIRSFWIFNGFVVDATKRVILELVKRDDIGYIEKSDTVWLLKEKKPPKSKKKGLTKKYPSLKKINRGEGIRSFNWNIQIIMADSVWLNYGISGDGVILGNMDTGVDVTHPALSSKFLGYWFDGVNGQPTPYDDHGHGTHTMGTMVGGDGPGSQFPDQNDVGIAYNAKFVAAKAFDAGGWGQDPWILACYEWFVTLKADSGVDLKIVSNSWGSLDELDLTFWEATLNWREFDIIPVFAIGNSGPSPSSTNTPGNFPIVIGVGATDSGDNIANFSSRGPAPNQSPWNDPQYWPRPDWNFIKPNISAPGVEVRSTVPGGGYESAGWSGTSMATPHVAGVIALMLELNPTLDFETIYDILMNTTDQPPQGGSYPNNNYGWGRVNAYYAVGNTPGVGAPYVKMVSYHIDDSAGNGNGIADPGETVTLYVVLKNLGLTANNVEATLTSNDTTITISDNYAFYGTLDQGDTSSGDGFVFSSDSSRRPGLPADFIITITGEDTAGSPFTVVDTFDIQIGLPNYFTWFYDDFESGNLGLWSTGGTTQWGLTTQSSHSPTRSATDSPSGNYGNNVHTYLRIKDPIDLSDAYFARIIFWHKYDIESGWDYGYVQVSTDSSDFADWSNVAMYTGTQSTWEAETLDISAMVGEPQVYIRFLFESDGSIVYDGWYVDDVEIQKDVPLEGIHLVLQSSSFSDSIGGNGNGIIDPGETIRAWVSIKNIGTDDALNVTGILSGSDDYITLTDSTTSFGDITSGSVVSNESDPFVFEVSPETPMGYTFSFDLYVEAEGGYVDTFNLNFNVSYGGDYLIWDPDETPLTGPFLHNLLQNMGLNGIYTQSLATYLDFLQNFNVIFVCVGIFPNNYVISEGSSEATALINYLTQHGGKLFLEGGDVWYYDPLYQGGFDFGPYFGINPIEDGTGDLYTVQGVSGTFTQGMSFSYAGENSWIDVLGTIGNGFAILQNPSPFYNCGIANIDSSGTVEYRTVGLSFELGGLVDGVPPSTREILIDSILSFFDIETGIKEEVGSNLPIRLALKKPSPNPFATSTNIEYSIPRKMKVSLKVYDITGRLVKKLFEGLKEPGHYSEKLESDNLSAGVYFIRLSTEERNITRKVVLLK
jgi:subtilisin family serine protease